MRFLLILHRVVVFFQLLFVLIFQLVSFVNVLLNMFRMFLVQKVVQVLVFFTLIGKIVLVLLHLFSMILLQ